MHRNSLPAIACAAALSGCAGLPPFNTVANVDRYIASLTLDHHSLPEARGILATEGFECDAQGHPASEYAFCTHVMNARHGIVIVTLTVDSADATRCIVSHDISETFVQSVLHSRSTIT